MFAFTCSTKQNVGALKTFMKGRIILPAKNDDKYVKECMHVTHHIISKRKHSSKKTALKLNKRNCENLNIDCSMPFIYKKNLNNLLSVNLLLSIRDFNILNFDVPIFAVISSNNNVLNKFVY